MTNFYKTKYNFFIFFQKKHKDFAKLDETKISPLTFKQIETDQKLKDELNHFREALFKSLNDLKIKLNEKQIKKMDKVECELN
jgi:hypothetical protein